MQINNIIKHFELNLQVIESLRQDSKIAAKNKCTKELLEINQTIQIIRYDNEKLIKELIKQHKEVK